MAYTTPSTQPTGTLITSTHYKAHIIDNIKFLHGPPRVSVIKNTASTTADNTLTTLSWNQELADNNSMWSSTAATLIHIRTPGTYLVGASIRWGTAGGGSREMFLQSTSATTSVDRFIAGQENDVDESNACAQSVSALVTGLTTNDRLSVQVRQDSTGGTLSVSAASTANLMNQHFWAIWQSS